MQLPPPTQKIKSNKQGAGREHHAQTVASGLASPSNLFPTPAPLQGLKSDALFLICLILAFPELSLKLYRLLPLGNKIWPLPVPGPHFLHPPLSHIAPDTLASCCPEKHQACPYLGAFALVPSACDALSVAASVASLGSLLTRPLFEEAFLLKQLLSLSLSFHLV